MFKFYEVGGCVRDRLMGLKPKDIDYVVVADQVNDKDKLVGLSAHSLFGMLQQYLTSKGYTIFLSSPENYTVRARIETGETVDFVMARKEIGYKEGTRQPIVIPGTLYDDLQRRDFTVNAIAVDLESGEYIDPFNGKTDILQNVLMTPLRSRNTLNDDPLRILRAIRFSITKKFNIHTELDAAIKTFNYNEKMHVVSEERIREELLKCLKSNTFATLNMLDKEYYRLKEYIFTKTNLWLKPTNEQ